MRINMRNGFCVFKYKRKRIILSYSKYREFDWYVTEANGSLILWIYKDLSKSDKSAILHKVLKHAI